MARTMVGGALGAAFVVALAAAGYALGQGARHTAREAHVAWLRAASTAEQVAARGSAAAARARGERAGKEAGEREARRNGRRNGTRAAKKKLAAQRRVVVAPAPRAPCQAGTFTNRTGQCEPIPQSFGRSPPANSPEGRLAIETSPYCKGLPPPPPDYTGPVQC